MKNFIFCAVYLVSFLGRMCKIINIGKPRCFFQDTLQLAEDERENDMSFIPVHSFGSRE